MIFDSHNHLNGSYDDEWLKAIAEKNDRLGAYQNLLATRAQYNQEIENKTDAGYSDKAISLIWKQFAWVQEIILTLEDIEEGTVDVIRRSTADLIELRTTPKNLGGTWNDYADAFVRGLQRANEDTQLNKIARGILSLDRTVHNATQAIEIIDRVVAEKASTGMLVGIDISGNPAAPRTLTGTALINVLENALTKNIGIAVHIGEVDKKVEYQEIDLLLNFLEKWKQENQRDPLVNPLHGRVRVGHAIYLEPAQRARITKLGVPVEVCPACHEKLNWWQAHLPHPAISEHDGETEIDYILSGTDDSLIFSCDAKQESDRVMTLCGHHTHEQRSKILEKHLTYRF